MTVVAGEVERFFLKCGFCGERKPLEGDRCRCGARVTIAWVRDPGEPVSPELVMVSRTWSRIG